MDSRRPETLTACPACGFENQPKGRFCSDCGGPLTSICDGCGNALTPTARFCSDCGAPAGLPSSTDAGATAGNESAPDTAVAYHPETVEFLGQVSVFRSLSPEVLGRMAARMFVVEHPEGPVLREDDPVDGLYVIKSGTAKVTKSAGAGGSEAVLALLQKGDSFGEIALIDGLPRSAGVVAMQPMECYFLGRDAFLGLLDEHPEMARNMLHALAAMVRNADEWVAQTI